MPRVFLITGCSTGFGQHLVQAVLDAGDIAVGKIYMFLSVYLERN